MNSLYFNLIISVSSDCCIKLWKSDSCQQALVDKTLVGAKVPSCQLTVKVISCPSQYQCAVSGGLYNPDGYTVLYTH